MSENLYDKSKTKILKIDKKRNVKYGGYYISHIVVINLIS